MRGAFGNGRKLIDGSDGIVSGMSCANHKFMQDTINQFSCIIVISRRAKISGQDASVCRFFDKEFHEHEQGRASSLGRHERSVRRTRDALLYKKATLLVP